MSQTRFPLVFASALCFACGAPDSGAAIAAEPAQSVKAAYGPSVESPAATPAASATAPAAVPVAAPRTAAGPRAPNPMGRIPILQYHLIGETEGRWERHHTRFRRDLELLYERGYRPISLEELLDDRIDLAPGQSAVLFTFDDASPGQFRYLERDGELAVDPTSAVGIWLDFTREHSDWRTRGLFCVLSGAEAGRSFFGDKGIEGQKSEWRFPKIRFLVEQGFEICNHTLWHANLARYPDPFVQEQIARLTLAVDSAVPGYRIRGFALPLGVWPANRELARAGEWREPRSGRVVGYGHDAIFLVAGGPARSPGDPLFDPLALPRVQVFGEELERTLDRLEREGARYVSAGAARTASRAGARSATGARGP